MTIPERTSTSSGGSTTALSEAGAKCRCRLRDILNASTGMGNLWAIAHETMHNFGFGYTHEMNRLDDLVQEQTGLFPMVSGG